MSLPFETNKTSTSGEPAKEGTVRIEVELEKTGDDSFPEFSYVALVDELKKQNPNSKPPNGADKGKMIRDQRTRGKPFYFSRCRFGSLL